MYHCELLTYLFSILGKDTYKHDLNADNRDFLYDMQQKEPQIPDCKMILLRE